MAKDRDKKPSQDHRDISRELDLFSFQEVAPGAPFWHPKGMIIFRELEKYARKINDEGGYSETSTPILVKKEVFEKSGHWQYFRENMFYFKDGNDTLALKPMNCPESTYIYSSKVRSWRDLPLRLAEIGRLHRNERSGTLGGMFRVRQLTMDDAHIYCRKDQIEDEVSKTIKEINSFYSLFGFKTEYFLATRPEKALGKKELWDEAEKIMASALKKNKIPFKEAPGEGAFYGPKIEVHIRDSQGRDWQLGTSQLDFFMLPEKFDLYYIGENGKKEKPVVIHRAIFGSFERFIGILLEENGGALPLWLAPVQVALLSINDKVKKYCLEIIRNLHKINLRVFLDDRNETIGKKIREAELQKIPYILVIGEKEEKDGTVNVRERGKKEQKSMKLDDFAKEISTGDK
ncbi:MAG: threonine--tRNA ligase [Candidatus Niyogibacteria bacterium]|nr:MAG: threonine--tRNA ligase [Candidatus Niyogibacteria bacterium]